MLDQNQRVGITRTDEKEEQQRKEMKRGMTGDILCGIGPDRLSLWGLYRFPLRVSYIPFGDIRPNGPIPLRWIGYI